MTRSEKRYKVLWGYCKTKKAMFYNGQVRSKYKPMPNSMEFAQYEKKHADGLTDAT
jgi:hypothetical protein